MLIFAAICSILALFVGYGAATRLVAHALPESDAFSRTVLALAATTAYAGLALFYCAEFDYRLSLFIAAPIALATWLATFRLPKEPAARMNPYARILTWACLASLAGRLVYAFTWPLPPGWDPAFHCLLASRIQETHGLIHDWLPYAPIPLIYPITPHVALAAASDLTRLPIHHVFSIVSVLFSILLPATLFPLARAAKLPIPHAAAATLLYLLSAWLGSTCYLATGTFSNMVGFAFFLPALTFIAAGPVRTVPQRLLLTLFLTATFTSHHHVLLTAGLALVPITLLFRRMDLLLPGLLSLGLSSPVWYPLLQQTRLVHATEALTYAEEFISAGQITVDLGWGVSIGLVIALFLALRKRLTLPRREALAALVILVALFVTLDYGCRLVARVLDRPAFTLFSASRFLTDAVPFLCLLGGAAVVSLLKHPKPWRVLVLCLVLAIPTFVRTHVELYSNYLPFDAEAQATIAAARWIRFNTRADVVVQNNDTVNGRIRSWLDYLTRRRTTYTPLPASEPIGLLDTAPSPLANGATLIDIRMQKWLNPALHHPIHITGPLPTDIAVSPMGEERGQGTAGRGQ